MDALSREEFVNRLRALTDARAIAAQDSPTGYRIEYEPFPGW